MAAVTQRIDSYLGGVSKQSDDKKLPGQVRECYNGFPDPTYGLTKRPGLQHIVNLGTGTTYDDGKWFYIKRDNDEEYVGVIKGTDIDIWNAVTGTAATVTFPDGTGYLGSARDHYNIITVQDTSIIVNNDKTVNALAAPTGYHPNRQATVVVKSVLGQQTYSIEITVNSTTQTATFTTSASSSVDDILSDLKTDIEAFTGDHAGITVTKLSNELEITHTADMEVHAEGGLDNLAMFAFEESINNVSDLPAQATHDRKVKIINTAANETDYWVKFVAHDGVSGEGFWEETIDPTVSTGVDDSTMPHELVNTATNTFVFRKIDYTSRLVGDDVTNPHPSFVTKKIKSAFFHNNRLGFLSQDNVIMSQSGEFFNFYFTSAQTIVDSDPIDISAASINPTTLHAAIPVSQGVALFSENEQFILFADAGVLTPSTTTIRSIASYEMDKTIHPVENGSNILFVSKTPGYSKVFNMRLRGQQENPEVIDIGKSVRDWISPDINSISSSSLNQIICLSGQSLKEMFIFRYFDTGNGDLMQSWVSWNVPGTVQFTVIENDDMYVVTKQASQFTLCKANLTQSPEDAIIVDKDGNRVNPSVDLYADPSSVSFNTANNETRCYLPWNDVTTLTPVLLMKGDNSAGTFVESGFNITPGRGSDGTGDYFSVPKKDLTSLSNHIVIGFRFDFDIVLPRTYYRPAATIADFTANLTIARMKFSVGLSGAISFKLKQTGRLPYEKNYTGDGTTTTFTFNKETDLNYYKRSDVIVRVNGAQTTDFSFSDDSTIVFNTAPADGAAIEFIVDEWFSVEPVAFADTYLANDVPLSNENVYTLPVHQRTENFNVRMFSNTPYPVAVNSMMWEGNYTPRFYRRSL